MLSLLVSSTNNVQTNSNCDSPAFIRRLPHDCLNHIFSYCPFPYHAYLVCRSWYHAVDRYVCLGDTFYYLPEGIDKVQKPRWFPSTSLPTLCNDERFQYTQVAYIGIMFDTSDLIVPAELKLCNALENVHLCPKLPRKIETTTTTINEKMEPWNVLHAVRKVSISCWRTVAEANLRGLEVIPTLEELNIHAMKIDDVSNLSECRTL
eukprot:PhF_6_TR40626/c1_g2_i14/m.60967